MDTNRIDHLFSRYFDAGCSEEERREFLQLVAQGEDDETLRELLERKLQLYAPDRQLDQLSADALFANIMQQADANAPEPAKIVHMNKRSAPYKWLVGTAVAILFIGMQVWLWYRPSTPAIDYSQSDVFISKESPKVAPGGNVATLTLDDGRVITLDANGNGLIASQGTTKIVKQDNGELSYEADKNASVAQLQFNTLSTPNGGQFKINLPDGSKVWLNAASSITYPTVFAGKTRKVTIKGEAYFEVQKNTAQPFIVQSNNMEVEVLGTHFNMNSYDDEPITRTTLVEGSVRVKTLPDQQHRETLKPGQQAQLEQSTNTLKVRDADIESVTAWKNGYFNFDGAPVKEVMRQISRWYNVDIQMEGTMARHFRGSVLRSASLDEVMHMLSLTGEFNYKIEGRTVIIKP